MISIVCNDFESFEKQMEHLDRTVEDPGLLPQIRAVVRQRKEALRRQEEEAQMHKHWENISRTAQGIEEFKRTVSQWGDEVAETARLVHEYDQRAEQQIKRGYRTCQLIGECISETNEYIGALQEYSQQSAVYIQDARQYIDGVNSYAQECNQLAQRAHQVEAGAILTRYTSQKHRYEGRGSF
ncbi:hypothetical protein DENSPDRAFT_838362 [Dentipellis sp. KUC8613]|nr:hypothetical protein DENSPDRAFT_838362 [Dentipellis sp. KUC8613]